MTNITYLCQNDSLNITKDKILLSHILCQKSTKISLLPVVGVILIVVRNSNLPQGLSFQIILISVSDHVFPYTKYMIDSLIGMRLFRNLLKY